MQECDGICLPPCLVEIDGEEVARLVQKQRVDASDERLTLSISPGQMPADDVVGDRKEPTMRADRAPTRSRTPERSRTYRSSDSRIGADRRRRGPGTVT
jgi:hypothetical protein